MDGFWQGLMNASFFPCTRRTSIGCAAALLLAAVHPDARRSFVNADLRDFLRKKGYESPVVMGEESLMCEKVMCGAQASPPLAKKMCVGPSLPPISPHPVGRRA